MVIAGVTDAATASRRATGGKGGKRRRTRKMSELVKSASANRRGTGTEKNGTVNAKGWGKDDETLHGGVPDKRGAGRKQMCISVNGKKKELNSA